MDFGTKSCERDGDRTGGSLFTPWIHRVYPSVGPSSPEKKTTQNLVGISQMLHVGNIYLH